MPQGRPPQSQIRDNLVELLFWLKKGYGYQLAKIYNEIFSQVVQKSIYYNLKKGAEQGIFEIHNISKEKGEFSWGEQVEKIYYTLGSNASPRGLLRIKKRLLKLGLLASDSAE